MAIAAHWEARIGRVLGVLCRWLAYAGGFVLVAAALVTVVSVIGRYFVFAGLAPVRGDFELVEAGCAIAIFSFLPWCQLNRGHVTVDVLVDRMPARAKAVLGLVGDITITVLSGLILWRLYLGFGEKFPYGSDTFRSVLGMGSKPYYPETTYELELPVWIPYGLATIGAALFFVVSLYTVWRALNWVLAGGEVAI
ncbi:TRAP transporter small permease [Litoreibacter arenae]|uniref:TRAP transporter small permease protein n=1 Tax=Litoreibacter arenae DSM 19593 TaxID=1123360 RepID=S9QHR5_9RHOB|nr:TRAP transporter small permease [Litoreibacter arenae]EPX79083.1 TRAP dicarboxylate transporter, DctQ subunit, unknown substrate 3 [Litoreibacter arenae DSM 19593]